MGGFTFVDLFSGAGGSTLGFVMAGFEPVGALDVYRPAIETYTYNLRRLGFKPDVREADAFEFDFRRWARELGSVDVVVGCPPCQGFSHLRVRGDGAACMDRRNGLVYVYLKAVKFFRPKAVVFENVPGITDSCNGMYFRLLRGGLERLGYRIAWGVLDAADYGVPQRRRRVILIGVLRGEPLLPPPTHARPGDPRVREGLLRPWRTVREAIADLPPIGPGEEHPSIPNHVTRRLPENWLHLIRAIPKDGGTRFDAPRRLWLPCHRRLRSGFRDVFARLRWDDVSNTITTGCWNPSKGRFVHPEQDRGLSLRECARLQGFPDSYIFKGKPTSIARQIGEALPPPLAKAIAESLLDALH